MNLLLRRGLWLIAVLMCLSGSGSVVLANPETIIFAQNKDVGTPGRVKPSQAFHFAYQDYIKGHYDLAVSEFQKFISDFPDSSMAAEAYYYLGECYEQQGNLKEAARALTTLLERYQTSRQVPAALFKLGKVMEKAGHSHKAKAYWSILLKSHRGSPEAKLAARRLDRISH